MKPENESIMAIVCWYKCSLLLSSTCSVSWYGV